MAIDLVIPVADVDAIIGTAANKWDSIRLYSASSQGGSYSLVTTIALVALTTQYAYTHTAGVPSTWYKVLLYNSVTLTESLLTDAEPFPAARGTLTLKALRQRIISNLGGEVISSFETIAAQSITAACMKDTQRDTSWFGGWHLYRPDYTAGATDDSDRRVSAYVNTTGQLSHGGQAYQDTTVTSEIAELMPVDISLSKLNEKIGDGLKKTRWLTRYEFGCTTNTMQYPLPKWVEDERYVPQVWRRWGTSPNNWMWKPIETFGGWAKVRGSNFQCTLDIGPSLSTNDVIGMDIWRPGNALVGETDFTRVQIPWAEAAAMVSVLQFLMTRDLARHGESTWGPSLTEWKTELRIQQRQSGSEGGARMQLPSPMSGFNDI